MYAYCTRAVEGPTCPAPVQLGMAWTVTDSISPRPPVPPVWNLIRMLDAFARTPFENNRNYGAAPRQTLPGPGHSRRIGEENYRIDGALRLARADWNEDRYRRLMRLHSKTLGRVHKQWHSLAIPLTRAGRKHIIRPFPVRRRPRQSSIIPNPSWVL